MPSVPVLPSHAPDDMVLRIQMLRDEAEALGHDTLTYLLEISASEAKRISEPARDSRVIALEHWRAQRR